MLWNLCPHILLRQVSIGEESDGLICRDIGATLGNQYTGFLLELFNRQFGINFFYCHHASITIFYWYN